MSTNNYQLSDSDSDSDDNQTPQPQLYQKTNKIKEEKQENYQSTERQSQVKIQDQCYLQQQQESYWENSLSTDPSEQCQQQKEDVLQELKKKVKKSNFIEEQLPFDEKLMLYLCEMQEAQIEIIVGKMVIYFIGATGAGKSSTINSFQSVAQLKNIYNKNNKIIDKKYIFDKEIAKTASNSTKSETLYLQAIEVPEELQKHFMEKMYFLDLPGTQDSRGFEIEISNQFMVAKALQSCKTIKSVIVISYYEFKTTKMESIKKTLKTFFNIIRDEKYYDSISIFVTQYEERGFQNQAQTELQVHFQALLNSFKEEYALKKQEEDLRVMKFLEYYMEYNYCPFFVYIQQSKNSEQLINYIKKNNQAIENPKEAIHVGQLALADQINFKNYGNIAIKKIENLLKQNQPSNFEVIKDIIIDLKKMNSYLNIESLREVQQKIKQIIINTIKGRFDQSAAILRKLENTDFGNNVTDQDIQNLKDINDYLETFDHSKINEFYGDEYIQETKVLNETVKICDESIQKTINTIKNNISVLVKEKDSVQSYQKACFQVQKLSLINKWQDKYVKDYNTGFNLTRNVIESYLKEAKQLINKIFVENDYDKNVNLKSKFDYNLQSLDSICEKIAYLQDILKEALVPKNNYQENQENQIQVNNNSFQGQIQSDYENLDYYKQIIKEIQYHTKQTQESFKSMIISINETFKSLKNKGKQVLEQQQSLENDIQQSQKLQEGENDKVQYNYEDQQKGDVKLEDFDDMISESNFSDKTNILDGRYVFKEKSYFILTRINLNENFAKILQAQLQDCQNNDNMIIELIEEIQIYILKCLENDKEEIMLKSIRDLKQELQILKNLMNMVNTKCNEKIQKLYIEIQQKIGKLVGKVGKSIYKIVKKFTEENDNQKGKNLELQKFFTKYSGLKKLLWVDVLIGNNYQEVQNTIREASQCFSSFTSKIDEKYQQISDDFLNRIKNAEDIELQFQIKCDIQNLIDIQKNLNSQRKSNDPILDNEEQKNELKKSIDNILIDFESKLYKFLELLKTDIQNDVESLKKINMKVKVLENYRQVSINFKNSVQNLGFKQAIEDFFSWYKEFIQNKAKQLQTEIEDFPLDTIDSQYYNNILINNNNQSLQPQQQLNKEEDTNMNQSQLYKQSTIITSENMYFQKFQEWCNIQKYLVQCQLMSVSIFEIILEGMEIGTQAQQQIQGFLDTIFDNYNDQSKFGKNLKDFHQFRQYLYFITQQFEKAFKKFQKEYLVRELKDPKEEIDKQIQEINQDIYQLCDFDMEKSDLNTSNLVKNVKSIQQKDFNEFQFCIKQTVEQLKHQIKKKKESINKFKKWEQGYEKNFDEIQKLQPSIEFLRIFKQDDLVIKDLDEICQEFEKQFFKKEQLIEELVFNLDIQSAYEEVNKFANIISYFNNSNIDNLFKPKTEHYNCDKELFKKVFLDKLKIQEQNLNNYEWIKNKLQILFNENIANKIFTDINLIIQKNINSAYIYQNFQSCYLEKYLEKEYGELQEYMGQHFKINKIKNHSDSLIDNFQKLKSQYPFSQRDRKILDDMIMSIEEKCEEFIGAQQHVIQSLTQNIKNDTIQKFQQNWENLDKDQKKMLQEEIQKTLSLESNFINCFKLEDEQYQNIEQILSTFDQIDKFYDCFQITMGKDIQKEEIKYEKQEMKQKLCEKITTQLTIITTTVNVQVMKQNDLSYNRNLDYFFNYVSIYQKELTEKELLDVDEYNHFMDVQEKIQENIANIFDKYQQQFDQEFQLDKSYQKVKCCMNNIQKCSLLYLKLKEIISQDKLILFEKLKQAVNEFLSFEDCKQKIYDRVKQNIEYIEVNLCSQQNKDYVIIKILQIQNVKVMEYYFKDTEKLEFINLNYLKQIFKEKQYELTKNIINQIFSCKYDNQLSDLVTKLKQVEEIIQVFQQLFGLDSQFPQIEKEINKKLEEIASSLNVQISHIQEQDGVLDIEINRFDPIIKYIFQTFTIENYIQYEPIQQKCRQQIDDYLNIVQGKVQDDVFIQLGSRMVTLDGQMGAQLTKNYQSFNDILVNDFMEKTSAQNYTYAADNIKLSKIKKNINELQNLDPKEKQRISNIYLEFKNTFEESISSVLIQRDQENKLTLEDLRYQCQNYIKQFKQKQNGDIDQQNHNNIKMFGQFLGKLFSIWSLFEKKQRKNVQLTQYSKKPVYKKPHPVQVISICIIFNQHKKLKENCWQSFFNLFSSSNNNNKSSIFKNQIAEILTGQGKSITLGITCIIFAMMEFQVNVSCYSKYLSQRDFAEFSEIFEFMGYKQDIFYGTYIQIIEKQLNKYGNIRDLAQSYFNDKKQYQLMIEQFNIKKQYEQNKKTVLLMDEVDQFFSQNIYGKSFIPLFRYQNQGLQHIFEYIWENRNQKKLCDNVMKLTEVQQIISEQQILKELITKKIKSLCQGAAKIKEHYKKLKPVVVGQKIGYRDIDRINLSSYFSCSTPFVYFQEHEKNPNVITKEIRDKECSLTFQLGQYSYAQVPMEMKFDFIIGVTGTLQDLDTNIIEKFKNYNINRLFYQPSIYSNGPATFKKGTGVKVCKNLQDYHGKIYDTSLKAQKNKQPVIIFFADQKQLDDYKNYLISNNNYDNNCYQTMVIQKDENYIQIINNATKIGMITLALAVFGRGTDFKCYNEQINKVGGLLVLITFISQSKVEEVQIMGRTGRCGQEGEIQFVINLEDLETDYDIKEAQIEKWNNNDELYDNIDQIRQERYEYVINNQQKEVDKLKPLYQDSKKLVQALFENNKQDIMKYLNKLN